jgi:hypothetical protein
MEELNSMKSQMERVLSNLKLLHLFSELIPSSQLSHLSSTLALSILLMESDKILR